MGKGRRKRHNMRRKGQIGNSISAIVISFALVLSIMPANQVKAAQAAAKVITEDNVETSYETIGEAVDAMTDGDTLCLEQDSSEKIEIPAGEKWKLSVGKHSYSGRISIRLEAGLELVDGNYTDGFMLDGRYINGETYITIDDGVTADKYAGQIMERWTQPEQWLKEYAEEQYIVETSTSLPYKVGNQRYASSVRATYDITDGDTLYIVEDTDRGLLGDNYLFKTYNIDAGNHKVGGDLYIPKGATLISGTFLGYVYIGDFTVTDKCRFTKDTANTLRYICDENTKLVPDSEGYLTFVPASASDKLVSCNGKTYVYAEHAFENMSGDQVNTLTFTGDYDSVISFPYNKKGKLDFGEYSPKEFIENFGELEIVSGVFDKDANGKNNCLVSYKPITISGGYFNHFDFWDGDWGKPEYIIKGGTFSSYAYEQIKDDLAEGYKAVYQNGNYVVKSLQSDEKLTGWQEIDNKWYYYNADGEKTTDWQNVDGKWYYMNNDGVMQTGWQSIGGSWYYMNVSGAMLTGWQSIGGNWYYMNGSGAMLTGWQSIGGNWYYMNGSGAMLTGWQSIGGSWYYMNGSGAMLTGWQSIGGNWYYMNGSGAMLTGWQSIGGNWYYMNGSGAMQTGWQYISGQWYYMNSSGVWMK